MTDHSKNDSWERVINLPVSSPDTSTYIRIRTTGSGVYGTVVHSDKDDKLDVVTLFPDQLAILTETLPDLVKHATKHDERIYKQNQASKDR